uniref:Uncharacterized protein n=1 Tax=Ciona savignyi TaxID=51511 RepID=H2YTG6_CIOSA
MRTWPNEIENNNHKLNFNNNLYYNENDHSERFNSRRVSFGEDLIHEDYDQSNYEPSVYDLYHNQQKNCGEFGPSIERRGRPGLSRQGSVKGESVEVNRPSAHQEYFNKPVRNRVPETYEDFVQRLSRELRDPELGLLEYNFRCDIMTCLNRLNPVVRWGVLYEFYEEAMDRFERILDSNLSPVNKENEWKNMLDAMVDDVHYFNVGGINKLNTQISIGRCIFMIQLV